VGKNDFEGTDGSTVKYYKVYVKNSDEEVEEVGSKIDFSDCIGKYGTLEFNAKSRDKGGYSLSLTKFTPGEKVDPIETEVF